MKKRCTSVYFSYYGSWRVCLVDLKTGWLFSFLNSLLKAINESVLVPFIALKTDTILCDIVSTMKIVMRVDMIASDNCSRFVSCCVFFILLHPRGALLDYHLVIGKATEVHRPHR